MGGYTYTTKEGDMWDYIAWKVYEDEFYVTELLEAEENRAIIDTYIFSSGVEVWCPYIDEGDLEEPEWNNDPDADPEDDESDGEDDDWRDEE